MRAATVVQVLQDLFYVLLHVLFYLWSLLNSTGVDWCGVVCNRLSVWRCVHLVFNGILQSEQSRMLRYLPTVLIYVPCSWPVTIELPVPSIDSLYRLLYSSQMYLRTVYVTIHDASKPSDRRRVSIWYIIRLSNVLMQIVNVEKFCRGL